MMLLDDDYALPCMPGKMKPCTACVSRRLRAQTSGGAVCLLDEYSRLLWRSMETKCSAVDSHNHDEHQMI